MSEHTASTRHIIDLAVTVPGDEGPDTDYLESIISTALMQAGFQPLFVAASEDVGLGGEEAAIVLNDEETFTGLEGCSIRRYDTVTDPELASQADLLGDTLLEL